MRCRVPWRYCYLLSLGKIGFPYYSGIAVVAAVCGRFSSCFVAGAVA